MDDFELLRHITIGQYLPTGSLVHRLDPRTKIVGFGLLLVAVAVCSSLPGLLIALALVLGLVALARVPLGFALGGIRPALPFLAVIAVLQLLFGWGTRPGAACQTVWSIWIVQITDCSIQAVLAMILRLFSLILLTSLLTLTSTTTELTHGIESLLRPFQRIGVPAHELALVFMLALRFVPTLAEELEKLLKAQAARGADIRLGSNPIKRTQHLLPVLVPLFLITLRRGEELIEAMTARGYAGGLGRSHYVRLRFGRRDAAALAIAAICAAGLMLPLASLGGVWASLTKGWF
jgi:energy-coupling factor transport system permease protein